MIAHAGGEFRGLTYTNSLEALNANYAKGFRWFEVDLEWTTDSELVLVHDWDVTFGRLFKTNPGRRSFAEYRGLGSDFTKLSFEDLSQWLNSHPDATIVTDVKSDNLDALRLIKSKYKEIVRQIIPQTYYFWEYQEALKLGFESGILTLYKADYSDRAVVRFAQRYFPYAITCWHSRVNLPFAKALGSSGVFLYGHTVNDIEVYKALIEEGAHGVYTDSLSPENERGRHDLP